MKNQNLDYVMQGKLFKIPDYQRGYAWEKPQWQDFVQDIDALIDDNIQSHYTGTLVIYQPIIKNVESYGINKIEIVDVVDGQQRLTTSTLYLSIVLNRLIKLGKVEYQQALTNYIYYGACRKLILNNDTNDLYFDLITNGVPKLSCTTVHQKRLLEAFEYLKSHIEMQIIKKSDNGIEYLKNIYDAITRKLNFSFYAIEEESEIGMTFELMNSRGKALSVLELLKNYLMYWVYRNATEPDRSNLTKIINKSWKEVYTNIANCNGSEDQCLRIAWILYYTHSPKNWGGYAGFKDPHVIPIRDFSKRSKESTLQFIYTFAEGLSKVSGFYKDILSDPVSAEERTWITKLKQAGNIANFLPVMVAAKSLLSNDEILESEYLSLLKSLETYSYRVFLWSGRRSNAGISSFYRWAYDLFHKHEKIKVISERVTDLCNFYSPEKDFRVSAYDTFDWYSYRNLLKYTLFEYELHLLKARSKAVEPKIKWAELSDATIEHILPQTPTGQWKKDWKAKDRNVYTHDISNLVLTFDNSRYSNFDFYKKKGVAGSGFCYSNSDIRQERQIASYDKWTVDSCIMRKQELSKWIVDRWGIEKHFNEILVSEADDIEDYI